MKLKASATLFLSIYALCICFTMTLVLVFDVGLIVNDITGLSVPEWRYASDLHRYNSDEAYAQYMQTKEGAQSDKMPSVVSLSAQALTDKRLRERANFLENTRASDITSLIKEFQWLFVILVFLFLHWRLYKKTQL